MKHFIVITVGCEYGCGGSGHVGKMALARNHLAFALLRPETESIRS